MENIELKRFWENIKEELVGALPESVHPWIYSLEVSGYDKGALTVVTGQAMAKTWLQKNHSAQINDILKNITKNENDTNNFKSSYNLKTNSLQQLTKNEYYISKLSTTNNNINKVKNINNTNNRYYYVNLGTSSELVNNNIYMSYNPVNKNKINDKYNFGKYNNLNYINSSSTNINNN